MAELVQKLNVRLLNVWIIVRNHIVKFFRKFYSHQHQLTSVTAFNRYPELFEASKTSVGSLSKTISILSFGCSTGEECFSIRNYFPKSKIIGVDINKSNLATAIKKNIYSNIKFKYSSEEHIREEGPYDIIFCLSVLCRWEDTKYVENCENIYPFEKFQSTVEMLSGVLNPGGHFVIYNSNFRLEDTTIFSKDNYTIVDSPNVKDSGFVIKFNKNNKRILEIHRYCIYRKSEAVKSES